MPRPKIYADTAARMRAYRARKAGTVTTDPKEFRERYGIVTKPSVTPAPVEKKRTITLSFCTYTLPLTMRDIGDIARSCHFTEVEIKRLKDWKAMGNNGTTDKPWNPIMEGSLRKNQREVAAAKKAILEALGGSVTPAPETNVTSLKEGMLVGFKLYTTDDKGKDHLVPMTFRLHSLPDGDGEFHRSRLSEHKGKQFASVTLEVIEEPKPVTVSVTKKKPARKAKTHVISNRVNEQIAFTYCGKHGDDPAVTVAAEGKKPTCGICLNHPKRVHDLSVIKFRAKRAAQFAAAGAFDEHGNYIPPQERKANA